MTSAEDRARMHIAQAFSRTRSPMVRRHLSAALSDLDGEPVEDTLVECPTCGTVGLPEQIAAHDCLAR